MQTISVLIPGRKAIQFDVQDDCYSSGDDSTFSRADVILDFEQASELLTAWCPARAEETGNPCSHTWAGYEDDETAAVFVIAMATNDAIMFDRWEATGQVGDFRGGATEYGYSLSDLPAIEWDTIGEDAPIMTFERAYEKRVYETWEVEATRAVLDDPEMFTDGNGTEKFDRWIREHGTLTSTRTQEDSTPKSIEFIGEKSNGE